MAAWQKWTFEAFAPMGPEISALAAGFAVMLWGKMYITPAGEAYLASVDGLASMEGL